MSRDLTGISLESENIDDCKRYCRGDSVIVERIPYVIGFTIRISWYKWWKPFYFKYNQNNILWLHWSIDKLYHHKVGKVVYDPNAL